MAFDPPDRPDAVASYEKNEQAYLLLKAVLYVGDALVALGHLLEEQLP